MKKIDSGNVEVCWGLLKEAIEQIYRRNSSQLSYEELYRNAYYMVRYRGGERLYEGVREIVVGKLAGVRGALEQTSDDGFLSEYAVQWREHCCTMDVLADILLYMDRHHCPVNGLRSVGALGLQLFEAEVVRCETLRGRLRTLMLARLADARGDPSATDLRPVQQLSAMLVALDESSRLVYVELFERPYVAALEAHYREQSCEWVAKLSAPEYVQRAAASLAKEVALVETCLDRTSVPTVRRVLEAQLVVEHMVAVARAPVGGLTSLIEERRDSELCAMVDLLARVEEGLALVAQVTGEHVRALGDALAEDTEEGPRAPAAYVEAVVALRQRFDAVMAGPMRARRAVALAVGAAFEAVLNGFLRAAEFLSLYASQLLTKGQRLVEEDVLMDRLGAVIIELRQIHNRDIFEHYYKIHLARRLLHGRSASDEAEASMMLKLKAECGFQFTAKLEGMFADMRSSAALMEAWLENSPEPNAPALDVHVLTTGAWPVTAACSDVAIPHVLRSVAARFHDFYIARHRGRRLTWHLGMGTADVRAVIGGRKYALAVSTYQMIVLLAIHDRGGSASLAQLLETGLSEDEVRATIAPLLAPRHPVLVADGDVFRANPAFKSRVVRVRVAPGVRAESPAEVSATRLQVDENRKVQIDSAIVRIMKARRSITHTNLVLEVSRLLKPRFLPEPLLIKKRVESLIERDYLTRTSRSTYEYVA